MLKKETLVATAANGTATAATNPDDPHQVPPNAESLSQYSFVASTPNTSLQEVPITSQHSSEGRKE